MQDLIIRLKSLNAIETDIVRWFENYGDLYDFFIAARPHLTTGRQKEAYFHMPISLRHILRNKSLKETLDVALLCKNIEIRTKLIDALRDSELVRILWETSTSVPSTESTSYDKVKPAYNEIAYYCKMLHEPLPFFTNTTLEWKRAVKEWLAV